MVPGLKSDIDATSRLEDQRRTRAIHIYLLKRKSESVSDDSVGFPHEGGRHFNIAHLSRCANKLTGLFPYVLRQLLHNEDGLDVN